MKRPCNQEIYFMKNEIYTIGHSVLTAETFVEHLHRNGITAVADVRSAPYSRFQPHFNRDSLMNILKENKIDYIFLGNELGARSKQPECYIDNKIQFDILARQPLFLTGIEKVIAALEKKNIALMCVEKDPLDCHRTILVARQLQIRGITVKHILYDGTVERHKDLEERMLKKLKIESTDLLCDEDTILADAYKKWGDRIAYVAK